MNPHNLDVPPRPPTAAPEPRPRLLCRRCGWEGDADTLELPEDDVVVCPVCARNSRAVPLVPLTEDTAVRRQTPAEVRKRVVEAKRRQVAEELEQARKRKG